MGPVELMVRAFPNGELSLSAGAAVGNLRKSGQVRLVDALVVLPEEFAAPKAKLLGP